ncbi:MAG: beta-N-acetylhexosaminidase, partial [Alphaproteobacteria bacterium]
HIWSETVRDRETLGYQIFPRMLALAERTWSRAGWEIPYDHAGRQVTFGDPVLDTDRQTAMQRDWNRFASLIAAKELTKLELADWSYRLPPPGAQFVDGKLQVNTDIPGLPVQCGSRRGWVALEHCAIEPEIGVHLRTTSWNGTRVSRVVSVIQSRK